MSAFVPVDKFFDHVYLVDLSPSLCDVARQRFERLGWKNVTVICEDARSFRLPERKTSGGAASDQVDLITMSYSLSMIPGRRSLNSTENLRQTDFCRLLQRRGFLDLAS